MRKLLALLLALTLVLGLAACGEKDKGGDDTPPPPSGTEDTGKTDTDDKVEDPGETDAPENPVPPEDEQKPETDTDNPLGLSESTLKFVKSIDVDNAEAMGMCGADLTWYYLNNVLIIRGTGDMNGYGYFTSSQPWYGISSQVHLIYIEDGVTSIGEGTFDYFDNLGSVYMPDSITSIGDYAFKNCEKLIKVNLPKNLIEIGDSAFYDTALTSAEIPDGVTAIGSGAFYNCTLTSVTIPASVTVFYGTTFDKCSLITFLGNAPELPEIDVNTHFPEGTTIYYSGSGFEEWIQKNPDCTWVKQ